ncbi:hypothetical protein KSP39_PZI003637 [Platanthera zijinensis]|uniref:Uncharacterized protein n=1 Tax=Platanthera zijinensis TaxID=2320716 RepID=A0AAP0BWE6_9ASPA
MVEELLTSGRRPWRRSFHVWSASMAEEISRLVGVHGGGAFTSCLAVGVWSSRTTPPPARAPAIFSPAVDVDVIPMATFSFSLTSFLSLSSSHGNTALES